MWERNCGLWLGSAHCIPGEHFGHCMRHCLEADLRGALCYFYKRGDVGDTSLDLELFLIFLTASDRHRFKIKSVTV